MARRDPAPAELGPPPPPPPATMVVERKGDDGSGAGASLFGSSGKWPQTKWGAGSRGLKGRPRDLRLMVPAPGPPPRPSATGPPRGRPPKGDDGSLGGRSVALLCSLGDEPAPHRGPFGAGGGGKPEITAHIVPRTPAHPHDQRHWQEPGRSVAFSLSSQKSASLGFDAGRRRPQAKLGDGGGAPGIFMLWAPRRTLPRAHQPPGRPGAAPPSPRTRPHTFAV